jgi:hypothetical protein
MITKVEQASNIFNGVMRNHSIALLTSPQDFHTGGTTIIPASREGEVSLAEKLFDLFFPRAESGVYYHYMPFDSFEKVMSFGSIRLFSTKKKDSIGEFITLCRDLGLDGYWREGADGNPEGIHAELMDDLFYKSFVYSPETNAEQLWDVFADKGSGVRIAVRVNTTQGYTNFRRVLYQGNPYIGILAELRNEYSRAGFEFIPQCLSRMPAYFQEERFSYQNEVRLVVKRHAGGGGIISNCFSKEELAESFPFVINRDNNQQCNYIDCSLQTPTCSGFQLSIVAAEPGPSCDLAKLNQILRKFTWAHLPCA